MSSSNIALGQMAATSVSMLHIITLPGEYNSMACETWANILESASSWSDLKASMLA